MRLTRRQLLKTAAAAGAAAATNFFPAPSVLADASKPGKLKVAVIGCINQGLPALSAAAGEDLIALVDVDENHLGEAGKFFAKEELGVDMSRVKTFFDYRKMFDALGRDLDAVFIATPDHHHACASMIAMQLGKHVYVEKPMAHSIDEARRMAAAAKKYKVVTQMGNQGHSTEGLRRLCEYLWAGAVGNVLETYSWAPTGRGGVGGRLPTKPVPQGLHWDQWIGPRPFRDYHDELHPQKWRTWWDFGCGSVGDWGAHNLDGVYTALKLDMPSRVEVLESFGGSQERFPLRNTIRWTFAAQGDRPEVKLHWYDGYFGDGQKPKDDETALKLQNRPPIVAELEKKFKRDFKNGGILIVGDKGYMVAGNYCGGPRIVPEEKHRAFPVPPKTLPRIKGTHQDDFLRACKGVGPTPCANFDYAAKFTEIILLGCLAEKAGPGKPVHWDAEKMTCPGMPELDRLIKLEYRKGWELG